MKKTNLNGKLSLKKETIAKLNDEQMNVVKGGGSVYSGNPKTCCSYNTYTCPPSATCQ